MITPILSVKDFDASFAFYTEKLGFKPMMALPGPDGKNIFGFVQLSEAVILGLSLKTGLEHPGQGVQFMLYIPDDKDLDTLYAEIQGRGVEIVDPLETAYWGDRIFSVHDLDGHYLTFAKTVKEVPMDEIQAAMRNQQA